MASRLRISIGPWHGTSLCPCPLPCKEFRGGQKGAKPVWPPFGPVNQQPFNDLLRSDPAITEPFNDLLRSDPAIPGPTPPSREPAVKYRKEKRKRASRSMKLS